MSSFGACLPRLVGSLLANLSGYNHYCPSNKAGGSINSFIPIFWTSFEALVFQGCYATGQSGCSGGYCPAPAEAQLADSVIWMNICNKEVVCPFLTIPPTAMYFL